MGSNFIYDAGILRERNPDLEYPPNKKVNNYGSETCQRNHQILNRGH
jgi:hypothetical protein